MAAPAASCSASSYAESARRVFDCFAESRQRLTPSGWLALCDATGLAGYLPETRLREIFDTAIKGCGPGSNAAQRSRAGLSRAGFGQALALSSIAVCDKQWEVEYASEKRARFHYRRKDAEKSRIEEPPEESLRQMLDAMGFADSAVLCERLAAASSTAAAPAVGDASASLHSTGATPARDGPARASPYLAAPQPPSHPQPAAARPVSPRQLRVRELMTGGPRPEPPRQPRIGAGACAGPSASPSNSPRRRRFIHDADTKQLAAPTTPRPSSHPPGKPGSRPRVRSATPVRSGRRFGELTNTTSSSPRYATVTQLYPLHAKDEQLRVLSGRQAGRRGGGRAIRSAPPNPARTQRQLMVNRWQ